MKVLLIGKYPPMQGGISAKTYWLYNSLKENGFQFRIVTYRDEHYSMPYDSKKISGIAVVGNRSIPWHIPETELIDERLCHHAIRLAESFKPDIIETNYLWPFCKDALLISSILKKPLIIRHAGSDILKFGADPEFKNIIKWYFNRASAIGSNNDAIEFVKEITDRPEKIRNLCRYIPDPRVFKPSGMPKAYDLLFAGKINYHWRLKGLELLLYIIKRKKLRSRFIVGGKYKNDFLALISGYRIEPYIDISDFIHCEQMPDIYNASRFVWNWEEKGTLDDFSNTIWESLFSNVPCILNAGTSNKIEKEGIPDEFSKLIYHFDRDGIESFDFEHRDDGICVGQDRKLRMHDSYASSNMELYQTAVSSLLE